MENYSSNNKSQLASLRGTKQSNSKSLMGLLLLFILLCSPSLLYAQDPFSKIYSLNASSAQFQAIAPQGNNGGFMAMAIVADSVSKKAVLKIMRYNSMGEQSAANIVLHPEYPIKRIFGTLKCLTRVHDNLYAALGVLYINGAQRGGFIMTIDSNGILMNLKDIIVPAPRVPDTFTYVSAVRYDGMGHLIVAGHDGTSIGDSASSLLFKYDTSLNLIWLKRYHPIGVISRMGSFDLTIKNGMYCLWGGANYPDVIWDIYYRNQAVIIATDTGGTELWHYTSSTAKLSDCEANITSGIQTLDGGYLYITSGHVYNAGKGLSIDLVAKMKLIKLDALRNKVWESVVDDYFTTFGMRQYVKLLELADSSFMLSASISTDSLEPNHIDGQFYLSHYSSNGTLLYRHALIPPLDANDTVKFPRGGHADFYQTADKGFILCGLYYNSAALAPATNYRAWLQKLDSNGCFGKEDPNCWPLALKEPKLENTIKIYPNPSYDFFEIDNTNTEKISLKITDILGKLVYQEVLPIGISQIDARQWAAGLYLYTIYQGNKIMSNGKLLKQY